MEKIDRSDLGCKRKNYFKSGQVTRSQKYFDNGNIEEFDVRVDGAYSSNTKAKEVALKFGVIKKNYICQIRYIIRFISFKSR